MARLPKTRLIQVKPMDNPLDRLKLSENNSIINNADVKTPEVNAEIENKSLKLDLQHLSSSTGTDVLQPNVTSPGVEEDDDDLSALGWLQRMASKIPDKIMKFQPNYGATYDKDMPPVDRLTPITEREEIIEDTVNSPKTMPRAAKSPKGDKSSGCFGFVSTWWAKRKAKRRQKKRDAIAARSVSPVAPLKQFEQKVSKGGIAFTLEVDGRPCTTKPTLPPSRPGTPCISSHEKISNASKRREEELRKKTNSGVDDKRAEILERKADLEYGFRTKAKLTILAKQGQAKRNRKKQEKTPDRQSFSSLGSGSETPLY